jgi:hypothetical protein
MIVQLTDRLGGGGHKSELVFLRSFREIERKEYLTAGKPYVHIYTYISVYPHVP